MPELEQLLERCVEIARQAGVAVMEIYDSGDFDITTKNEDGYISPLTRADTAANEIIEAGLRRISDWPIMSEEGSHDTSAKKFWCVDPIDGTKEFIKKNGEFTVNIGLVENQKPILGVVLAPAQNVLYFGAENYGAFKQVGDSEPQSIEAKFSGEVQVIAVSRSHLNEATEEFLAKLGNYELLQSGSSIKFCLVADGSAAIYPRLGESHLWDTAAADAVLRAAGGKTLAAGSGQTLMYDPSQLLNPFFIASVANVAPEVEK